MLKVNVITFLLYAVNLFYLTLEDSCLSYQNLGIVFVIDNTQNGSVIFKYTNLQNASDISTISVLPPNNMAFYFDLANLQLIALTTLSLKNALSYLLRFEVTCTSNSVQIFEQTVVIKSSNDNMAVWIFSNLADYYVGEIPDSSTNNTLVTFSFQPSFSDNDFPRRHEVEVVDDTFYGMLDGSAVKVNIYNKKLLDYDIKNKYNFTMILKDIDIDTGSVKYMSNATVIVNVKDTDSKPPIFEYPAYTFQIYNNAANGSTFQVLPKSVRAYDGDLAINTTILYKFSSPTNIDYVYLNPDTGILSSNSMSLKVISIQTSITAYQKNNVNRFATADIVINILMAVKFAQKLLIVYFEENIISQSVKMNYTSDQNKVISFTMDPVVQNLRIDSTGQILVVGAFNYNTQNFYNVTVTGSDGITNDQMILSIYVNKSSNTKITFDQPFYEFIGDRSSGYINGIIKVTNVNPNNTMIFKLNADYKLFQINSSNGYIYIPQDKLSGIQPTKYQLIVTVSDSLQSQISESVIVILDFSSLTTSSSTKSSVDLRTDLLFIYIFIPIIILLILIFPILLCYYKKRRIFNTRSQCLEARSIKFQKQCRVRQFNDSPKFNENIFSIFDLHGSNSFIRQLRKECKRKMCVRGTRNQENSKQLANIEISKINCGNTENPNQNSTNLKYQYSDMRTKF